MALVISTSLIAMLFFFTYTSKRQLYLLFWAIGWGLLGLHYACPAMVTWSSNVPWQMALDTWLFSASVLVFLLSARIYMRVEPWVNGIGATALVFAVWAVAYAMGYVAVSPTFGDVAVLGFTAQLFWRESRREETPADFGLTVAFAAWAATGLAGEFAKRFGEPVQRSITAFSIAPLVCIAVLMGMALYGEEKRRIERNMLALSNVNLTTSGLIGTDVQKMLAQALERVLNVVRMPRGALFLHHGNTNGPTSIVAEGLSDEFCSAAHQEGLDDHLVNLVARLGGLAVFTDLNQASDWTTLDKEAGFQRFRELAQKHGLRTVAAVSLQAKERNFGVLVLGTDDSRKFTSAELRLLLALGHQMGMAVENSYLIQQTARRSEELHALNEIGRILSSTLDADAIITKIHEEMSRLLDIDNLYIAYLDGESNQLTFELEVRDGERFPKRSRPAGNHLSEYVIRSRQPLLIPTDFTESVKRLGVEPIQQRGSFCGVPLTRGEKAFGLLAAHANREHAFDEGHLELMRVLASEAVIALENARLFKGEQAKARQLALLNNISRNAIATFNVEEMLARIIAELGRGLNYDHVGIGVLNYESKEIVIQAEAGARKHAIGRKIELGEGLIGRVARSGETAFVRDYAVDASAGSPVLEGSVSAAALPIFYAEQLYGVLYVESAELRGFTEDDLQLLGTLADLISSAVHNAISYQRAQEQAMTDGLTGIRTHRFFMETLNAEWKRSTRAGRPFSIVLIDLDRFKFVNDFYGHLEGDLVLQRVARILEQTCRRSDVVARYGGDEFVVLMPETNIEQARQLAAKLRQIVASDDLLREKNIGGSFGVASFPVHGSTPQELIQLADSSMYLSKRQGGNAVSSAEHFDPNEAKKWKKGVLETYLGVALRKPFKTGLDAFADIHGRLQQFGRSSSATENGNKGLTTDVAEPLPAAVTETLTSLVKAIDDKDSHTVNHSQRVSNYAAQIAQEIGLSAADVEEIRFGALLHDIGKVGVSELVLQKNGTLSPEEWDEMQKHIQFGAQLLEPFPAAAKLREMVLHHHEFFDGSGYPDGLAGEQIPIGGRIIALADAFDTITSERSYKRARPAEQALAELERCAGTQFDPKLVSALVEVLRRQPRPACPQPSAPAVVGSSSRS